MGDGFQNLVAPDIAAAQAQAAGERMLQWLVAEEIVLAETTDCVLSAGVGHPPGPHYAKATGKTDPLLLKLGTNGLAVITKRTVFHSGQGGAARVLNGATASVEVTVKYVGKAGRPVSIVVRAMFDDGSTPINDVLPN